MKAMVLFLTFILALVILAGVLLYLEIANVSETVEAMGRSSNTQTAIALIPTTTPSPTPTVTPTITPTPTLTQTPKPSPTPLPRATEILEPGREDFILGDFGFRYVSKLVRCQVEEGRWLICKTIPFESDYTPTLTNSLIQVDEEKGVIVTDISAFVQNPSTTCWLSTALQPAHENTVYLLILCSKYDIVTAIPYGFATLNIRT